MFGDFFKNFGLNDLLQEAFKHANAPPFGAGASDPQGGMFGNVAGPPEQLHMAGLGAPAEAPQMGAGGLGAPPGTQGQEMAKSAPTAAAVAPNMQASPLGPGAAAPGLQSPFGTEFGGPGGMAARADLGHEFRPNRVDRLV